MSRHWPNDVPHEQNSDGATLPQSYRPPLSSPVEAGPDITLRRTGPRMTIIPWKSIPLTEAQWEALDKFFLVTLIEGTLPFWMPVYRPNRGYIKRYCRLDGGLYNSDLSIPDNIFVSFDLVVFNF